MPLPAAAAAAAIAGGSAILGQGINAFSQGKMNKKTRKWNEKMYQRQRQDNLADWAMANQYNSPEAQMARLKAAGLNPNLVYENGATHTAQSVRGADTPSWNPEAPKFDLGSAANAGISAYYDTQVKSATADNLKATNAVLVQEALLKAAQIGATIAGTDKTKFDLDLAKEIKQYSVEAARLHVGKTGAEIRNLETATEVTLNRDEREAAMNASNLREAATRIIKMRIESLHEQQKMASTILDQDRIRQQIANMNQQMHSSILDNELKKLDIQLKRLGLQPSDELWQRLLAKILNTTILE